MEKNVYKGSEQVEKRRKENSRNRNGKQVRNLFRCIKNMFHGRRAKLKGHVMAKIKLH